MGKRITDKVTWVGKVDWELKKFHGDEFSTHRGSSYNSYLIRDKKTALIDTVWLPYDKEFVSRLKEEIDLSAIDYVIANHGEVDHSGALSALMRKFPAPRPTAPPTRSSPSKGSIMRTGILSR